MKYKFIILPQTHSLTLTEVALRFKSGWTVYERIQVCSECKKLLQVSTNSTHFFNPGDGLRSRTHVDWNRSFSCFYNCRCYSKWVDIYLIKTAIRGATTEKQFRNVFAVKNASVGKTDHISLNRALNMRDF